MKVNVDQEPRNSYDAAIESRHHKYEISTSQIQFSYRKTITGICLVLSIALCRSGMNQFGRNLYTNGNFTASSLVVW
ncbi:hypothetical protein TrispH2_005578 [Trichoplax sp. H2]|nr:hypothetical protein TrispH2_005578 [Trichoplax sp. H2]|eukprot:RDD42539.1 hypothetical protein TrispH2_005578 [Trichoplax sp. H2]